VDCGWAAGVDYFISDGVEMAKSLIMITIFLQFFLVPVKGKYFWVN
jgi:hypothetical protein